MKGNQTSEQTRVLGISLSSSGFGYAIMEGKNLLVGYGNKVIKNNKNPRAMVHIEKVLSHYRPDILAIHNVTAKDTYRHLRIKKLHRRVVALVKGQKIKVVEVSGRELRATLLGNPKGTKYEMAETLAKRFPDELASRLPPKRKFYDSEDARMDIFDAAGLAVVFHAKQ